MSVRSTALRASAGIALLGLVSPPPAAAESAECLGLASRDAVVCEINRVRAVRGLAALERDRRLRRAAVAQARDMVARGYFSHVTPDGQGLSDRLRASGYITGRVAWHVGETLAWGRGDRSTPSAAVDAWMRSRSHRRVLLGPFADIGVGVADGVPSGGDGATYAADFGRLGS
jgi:uncharacterized protein YkwD